jgi:hypothetical protein
MTGASWQWSPTYTILHLCVPSWMCWSRGPSIIEHSSMKRIRPWWTLQSGDFRSLVTPVL